MYTFVKSTHHRGLTTRGDAFFIVAPALTTNPLIEGAVGESDYGSSQRRRSCLAPHQPYAGRLSLSVSKF